jgi:hypothetical protein
MSLLRREPCPLQLRGRDILEILTQAERYADWKEEQMPRGINRWPIVCRAEPQPGLFAQLVIVRTGHHIECIVRRGIRDQLQLMDAQSLPNAFPTGISHTNIIKHNTIHGQSAKFGFVRTRKNIFCSD